MSQKVPNRIIFREYFESLLVAIVIALILRFFVISAYKIPTGSMTPTLKVGDFVFAYKLNYGVTIPFSGGERMASRLPLRGDVIVFKFPGHEATSYVKRVIGLPGDHIQIKNKKLYVNGAQAQYTPENSDVIGDLPSKEYYSVYNEEFYGSSHLIIYNQTQKDPETSDFGPIVVPPQNVFVLGDNRDSSDDSRYWGSVPVRNIEGQVVLVWLSLDWLNRWGTDQMPQVRWSRVFQAVR